MDIYTHVVSIAGTPMGVYPSRNVAMESIALTVGPDGVDWDFIDEFTALGTCVVPRYPHMGRCPITIIMVAPSAVAHTMVN